MANIYRLRSQTFNVVMEEPTPYGPITSPRNAIGILQAIMAALELDECQEHMLVVALDARGRVVGHKVVASGTGTSVQATPAMVFRAALVLGGETVLVAHNHPSGDPAPSREDSAFTARLRSTGAALGLPLADHIILGRGDYHSFRVSEQWGNA